jgi:FeS assembly SUF system regulator
MIRLSRLADYAVMLMTHMANDRREVHNAFDIAAQTGLPAPTVAKVLAVLVRGGLLVSQRGAKGGYQLARQPSDIPVSEIIVALDGPVALTSCIKAGPSTCEVEPICPSRHSLHRINEAVRRALSDITLADIAAPAPMFLPKPIPAPALAPRGNS